MLVFSVSDELCASLLEERKVSFVLLLGKDTLPHMHRQSLKI